MPAPGLIGLKVMRGGCARACLFGSWFVIELEVSGRFVAFGLRLGFVWVPMLNLFCCLFKLFLFCLLMVIEVLIRMRREWRKQKVRRQWVGQGEAFD